MKHMEQEQQMKLGMSGVDWIESIPTQALVKDFPRRNILHMKFLCIKITQTVIIETNFVNRQQIGCNSRYMKDISKLKFMKFGAESRITYMVDW